MMRVILTMPSAGEFALVLVSLVAVGLIAVALYERGKHR